MKIAIWTYVSSPHQNDFFDALRKEGVDLCVRYCFPTLTDRLQQGWKIPELKAGEAILQHGVDIFFAIPDWRKHIHIIAGYGLPPLRRVIWRLHTEKVPWVHWSEHPNVGFKRYFMHPIRMLYAQLINHTALGALAISQLAARSFVSWGVRPDRIAILPYSVAPPVFSESDLQCKDFMAGKKVFLFVGRLDYNKGAHILLHAFRKVISERTDWILLLVGTGNNTDNLKKLAVQLGICKQVLFRGQVPSDKIGNILSLASVLVTPTILKDGWGVVLNEAAAMGLPLIASHHVGAGYHLIDPGVNGYRVIAGSIESLAEAMQVYMRNPDLIAVHGAASRRIFSQYTPECNAQRLINILGSWTALRQ
jgi:glycosyltransferase involved in cell wall biosynthesis